VAKEEMGRLPKFFTDSNLNEPRFDKLKCAKCGKIPPIKKKIIKTKKGKRKIIIDRSSRIDCDAGRGDRSYPVTYCKECWWAEVMKG